MKTINYFLCFGVIILLQSGVDLHSLNKCPDEDKTLYVAGIDIVVVPGQPTTGLVRRVRLPQVGLYEYPLSCILVTDTSMDDSGGDVDITEGGIGHKYVEIRLQSNIGKDLDYVIIVYHDEPTALNTTQVNTIN